MKKLILICMMFATIVNYAADHTTTPKPNAELIGSWQYKTTYVSNGTTCKVQIDNYLFYSDNTCVKETKITDCQTNVIQKSSSLRQWKVYANHIVFQNSKGKQLEIVGAFNDVSNLLKGQKMMAYTKEIEVSKKEKNNNDQLAMVP